MAQPLIWWREVRDDNQDGGNAYPGGNVFYAPLTRNVPAPGAEVVRYEGGGGLTWGDHVDRGTPIYDRYVQPGDPGTFVAGAPDPEAGGWFTNFVNDWIGPVFFAVMSYGVGAAAGAAAAAEGGGAAAAAAGEGVAAGEAVAASSTAGETVAASSTATTASDAVFDLSTWFETGSEYGEWGELAGDAASAADAVDWSAVAESWEGAVAESAAQNAALEAASSLNWLDPVKEVGTRVATNLLNRELFGRVAPQRTSSSGAAAATTPRVSAPQGSMPNPFRGVAPSSWLPGSSTPLSSSAASALTLGALVLAVVVSIKVLSK